MRNRLRRIALVSLPILILASAAVGARSLAAAGKGGQSERTFDLTYKFKLQGIPADAANIRIWTPMPLTDRWQTLESFSVGMDRPHETVEEDIYGNRFVRIDLSGVDLEEGGEIDIALQFRVRRRAYDALNAPEIESAPSARGDLERFLSPDNLVPIDGRIAEEARRVAGHVDEPLRQARLLYEHIVESVVYDKSGAGWGRGDALYACDKRTGNCTDFHSLFIGEARALGVPSRFIMGLPIPENASEGSIPGYHCWAEFYIEGKGWIPVDASEAHKNPDRREALFGGLDANRIAFTIGRDIEIPGADGELMNYVIYPHVEVDGRPHTKMKVEFFFSEADA